MKTCGKDTDYLMNLQTFTRFSFNPLDKNAFRLFNGFQLHIRQAQDEGVLVAIHTAFEEGAVGRAAIGHH